MQYRSHWISREKSRISMPMESSIMYRPRMAVMRGIWKWHIFRTLSELISSAKSWTQKKSCLKMQTNPP
nr:MAG TPA: hypothetical protein [Caudoviricetes sp.]